MSNESSERRVRETDSADKCGRSAVNYSTAQPTKLYVGCSGSVFSALAHQLIKYTQRYQPAYPKDAVDLSKWRLIYLFNEKCTTRNAAASMLYSIVCGSHFAFLIWHFRFVFAHCISELSVHSTGVQWVIGLAGQWQTACPTDMSTHLCILAHTVNYGIKYSQK